MRRKVPNVSEYVGMRQGVWYFVYLFVLSSGLNRAVEFVCAASRNSLISSLVAAMPSLHSVRGSHGVMVRPGIWKPTSLASKSGPSSANFY